VHRALVGGNWIVAGSCILVGSKTAPSSPQLTIDEGSLSCVRSEGKGRGLEARCSSSEREICLRIGGAVLDPWVERGLPGRYSISRTIY
jgi:hypothetical protein